MATMTDNVFPTARPSNYMDGTAFETEMKVELMINDQAEVLIFHNKPFNKRISWIELDLDHNKLDFVMNDGDQRNLGLIIKKDLTKYLQNAYQILMVLTDDKTGQPVEGEYFPLIMHRA